MSNPFYYLAGSLPTLQFGMEKLPLTLADFDAECSRLLPASAYRTVQQTSMAVKNLATQQSDSNGMSHTAARYAEFESALRNALLLLLKNQRSDSAAFQRGTTDYFSEIPLVCQAVQAAANPFDAEMALDRARWNFLDNLEAAYHFDLENICIYKLKLELLSKRIARTPEAGSAALDGVLSQMSMGHVEN